MNEIENRDAEWISFLVGYGKKKIKNLRDADRIKFVELYRAQVSLIIEMLRSAKEYRLPSVVVDKASSEAETLENVLSVIYLEKAKQLRNIEED